MIVYRPEGYAVAKELGAAFDNGIAVPLHGGHAVSELVAFGIGIAVAYAHAGTPEHVDQVLGIVLRHCEEAAEKGC